MHDINHKQTDDVIYDSLLDTVQSSKKRSSIIKRRAIKERIDGIMEQRELQRLIEDPY